MSVVPGFKYDLFISYAHLNDQPWGWVTGFIQTLKAELESKSRDFTIWWDPGLRTGENFDRAIADVISESAVFLSVLSLAYGDSTYCKREVEQFRQLKHPVFGLTVGSMSRMQAITLDREYTRDRWPAEFRGTSPQPFFDERSALFGRPATLVSSDPWVQGLWKVRDSIWAVLSDMKNLRHVVHSSTGGGVDVMQIAEVTDDLYRRRESLRSALKESQGGGNCQVSAWSEPTAPPVSGSGALSVHLFGRYPGRGHGSGDVPLSRLQLEETLRSKPARRPLVWVARELQFDEAETPEHKVFLEGLAANNDVELLRTDFEDLKDEVTKRILPAAKLPETKQRTPRVPPIIHIWHSMENVASLQPLKQYLNNNDCGISVFNCSSTPMEKMQSRLAVCDGLIVPYTPETRTWAEDVMTEAFRLRRREERPTAFAAVELPPATDEEFNFEHPRVVPVHVHQPGSFDDMAQFLVKLEQAGA